MSHRREAKLTLNKVDFLGLAKSMRWPQRRDRRRRRNSIAGDGLSGPEVLLTALLNHRSPGVSPGTWESRGMSPTGYPGYPTPLPCASIRRLATAVLRPDWTAQDKPIARRRQKNFRIREMSSRLPFSRSLPVAYALNGPISRRIKPRNVS